MVGNTQIKVSKLDAARRQLETAIRLYFSEADPISIHALTSAAYQVLMDINAARGGTPMLKEQLPNWVRPDATESARRKLNEATNFFKHADRDHDEVLEFRPEATDLFLYDAVRKYRELTGEMVPLLGVYDVWFWLGPGAGFIVDPEREKARQRLRKSYPNATRASFFAKALPIMSTIKT
jgi:hypothetical protein